MGATTGRRLHRPRRRGRRRPDTDATAAGTGGFGFLFGNGRIESGGTNVRMHEARRREIRRRVRALRPGSLRGVSRFTLRREEAPDVRQLRIELCRCPLQGPAPASAKQDMEEARSRDHTRDGNGLAQRGEGARRRGLLTGEVRTRLRGARRSPFTPRGAGVGAFGGRDAPSAEAMAPDRRGEGCEPAGSHPSRGTTLRRAQDVGWPPGWVHRITCEMVLPDEWVYEPGLGFTITSFGVSTD